MIISESQLEDTLGDGGPRTKALMIMFEKAPSPPVGKAFVKEMRVTAHTVGSVRASTEANRYSTSGVLRFQRMKMSALI